MAASLSLGNVLSMECHSDGLDLKFNQDQASREILRKAWHDYQGAIRTLQYLAEEQLKNPPIHQDQKPLWEAKQQSLQNHKQKLKIFHEEFLNPLYQLILKEAEAK